MVRNWENTFSDWAKPPGKTEEQRIENAIKAIKNAIAASSKLNTRDIKVFTQGSYSENRGQPLTWDLPPGPYLKGKG